MVMREFRRTGLCLFLLIASGIGAWGMAHLLEQKGPRRPPLPGYAAQSRRTGHAYHPVIDDGPNSLSFDLRPLDVLSFSGQLSTLTSLNSPGPAKDLLSFTQQRRE